MEMVPDKHSCVGLGLCMPNAPSDVMQIIVQSWHKKSIATVKQAVVS